MPFEPMFLRRPGGGPRIGWWQRLSLRARLMLLGTCGLAVALGIGSVALVVALTYGVRQAVDDEAQRTAVDVADYVEAGDVNALPDPLPVAGGNLVQIVDAQHRVRAASVKADRMTSLLRPQELARARAGERSYIPGYRAGEAGDLRVVALATGPPGDPLTVIVARPVADLTQSLNLLRNALIITYPLVLIGLAAVAWRAIGAALRPVETLRSSAERITGSGTAERLPVPPSRDEIHRLAVTLNDMLDRLAAGRARQRSFVADAAHELRSPLANMRTALEVSQRLGEGGELVTDLLVDVERLGRLVDDLLLLARADERARPVATGPVELRSLLREVHARCGETRVPVLTADGEAVWTVGDQDGLHRVILNLLDNAVRHAATTVRLEVGVAGRTALVCVTDDGPGIPAADRERVFGRFTRLDDARARDAGGAGLGLAIVRELVRRHGGSVALLDAHPGVRAEVRLPLADDPEA